jgi:hypothetical protein
MTYAELIIEYQIEDASRIRFNNTHTPKLQTEAMITAIPYTFTDWLNDRFVCDYLDTSLVLRKYEGVTATIHRLRIDTIFDTDASKVIPSHESALIISREDLERIAVRQKQYIQQQADRYFEELKLDYMDTPTLLKPERLEEIKAVLGTIKTLPSAELTYLQKRNRELWGLDKFPPLTSGLTKRGLDTIKEINSDWVRPYMLDLNQYTNDIEVLACKMFLNWLSEPEPTQEPTESPEAVHVPLTHAQVALLYFYTDKPITKNNRDDIARLYGHQSGPKLFTQFERIRSHLNERTRERTSIENLNKIIPLIEDERLRNRALEELETAERNKN